MQTEELLSSAGETVEYAKIYIEQQKRYFRLESAKRVAKTTSNLGTLAIIGFLAFMVIIFLSISVGFLLGSYLGSYGVSFLIVTLFYALAGILVFVYKKRFITEPIMNVIISEMLD